MVKIIIFCQSTNKRLLSNNFLSEVTFYSMTHTQEELFLLQSWITQGQYCNWTSFKTNVLKSGSMMMKQVRRLFIIIVFLANIFIIALPIIEKFLADGVMIEVSTRDEDGLLPPAITFCRRSADLYGWQYNLSSCHAFPVVDLISKMKGSAIGNVSISQKWVGKNS